LIDRRAVALAAVSLPSPMWRGATLEQKKK